MSDYYSNHKLMKKLLILAGLTGSGKTIIAEQLAK